MTVEKLKKLENVIKPILEEQPQTREDDLLLYAEIIKRYKPNLHRVNVITFLEYHNDLNVPNIKSVERARRKVQEKHPELASERAKRRRAIEQQAYVQYGRG